MSQVTKKKEKWLLHSDRTDWRISSVIQREDAEHVENHAFAMSERTREAGQASAVYKGSRSRFPTRLT